ncbi:MAG: alpha/beta hydrolase [Candidatus Woesearchaeota archaeon]|nr:alpha/beta hydrolase [Candidatus Woesearchaeota archaeon]
MKGYEDVILGKLSLLKKDIFRSRFSQVEYKIIGKKKKAVIYYHGWGSSSDVFAFLKNKLEKDYTIILFDYPLDVITSDTKKTVAYFEEILLKTRQAIKESNVEEVNLFGTSLGGFLSVYIAKRIRINKMILSVAGSRLSDVFWTSIAGVRIKEALVKKGYDLRQLQEEWKAIDPIYNISKTKTLAYTSLRDRIVLYQFQEELVRALDAKEIREETFGHDVTGGKNLMDYKTVKEFLEK